MKRLVLDIEMSPNVAHVWQLWNNNVSLSQLQESASMISVAAKWRGEKKVHFYSDHHTGHEQMVNEIYALVDEADAVVHWNGTRFDMPHLYREFVQAELPPPSPVKEIDLMRVVKKKFRFPSNKLDYVAGVLLGEHKVAHEGHTLWVKCMAGDEKAWALMRRYNIEDVRLTERLYEVLLPWVPGHPHMGLYSDNPDDVCSRCESDDLEKRGFAYTPTGKYQQYVCRECGAWSRGKRALATVDVRGI